MTIKEFFSLKKNKLFWLNLLAIPIVIVALIFLVLKGLNMYTRHGEAVVVPKAEGMNVFQAEYLFSKEGLKCVVTDSTYVKDKPAGVVLDHNPQSGQKVKKGRIIYLTINTMSIPLQMVPDVADNSS
ncbi:PASTA domain-containing protein, partial [Bacteroides sp. OttesenSCG-928-E20]|nr:PASTA domain-containing protein [Bacteroides sp. OttesenSCG-928-E20]